MSRKLLPLAEPRILGYLHHSYVLSVMGNCANFADWFHSNYVQLFDDYLTGGLNFYEHDFTRMRQPLLSHHSMCIDAFKAGGYDIVEFAKHCMNEDYYFYTFVDEGQIPGKWAYKAKTSFPHEIMVFGYDDEAKQFHAVGFSDKMQYEKYTIPYESFAQGFDRLEMTAAYMNNIHLLKPDHAAEYPFMPGHVIRMLEDYVLSRNTSERYGLIRAPFRSAFGMACYDFLIEYFERVIAGKAELKVNSLHVLWEHKKCMVDRVQYMQRQHGLLQDFDLKPLQEIERFAYKTRDELIVFSITNDAKCFRNIVKNLAQLREKEAPALGLLLDRLTAAVPM